MPTAFALELRPQRPQPAPRYLGQYAHGLFYHLLERLSPNLSAEVHAAKTVPFTLEARGTGEVVTLRVALLQDDLFAPLLQAALSQSLEGLQLGSEAYTITRVLMTPEGHPRAMRLSWDALVHAPPTRTLELDFLSPTLFTTSGLGGKRHYTPLPEPRLVLGSLLRVHQAFSPDPYLEPSVAYFKQMFEDLTAVLECRIQTHSFPAGKQALTGFVGQVTLGLLERRLELEALLGRMGALAPFCGVGTKTPYGMGQVAVRELA